MMTFRRHIQRSRHRSYSLPLVRHRRGLDDERGQLTLKFIEVANANDDVRGRPAIVFLGEC